MYHVYSARIMVIDTKRARLDRIAVVCFDLFCLSANYT